MRNELNLWVAGGDMRQAKLAELLAADGHTVHAYALERLGALDGVEMEESLEGAALADCVVLPLPAVGEGSLLNAPLSGRKHPLALVLDALRPGQVICAGMVPHMNPALFITMRKSLLNRRYIFPVFSIFPGRRPCTRIC